MNMCGMRKDVRDKGVAVFFFWLFFSRQMVAVLDYRFCIVSDTDNVNLKYKILVIKSYK